MIKFRKSAVKSQCGQTRRADCDTPHGGAMIGASSPTAFEVAGGDGQLVL